MKYKVVVICTIIFLICSGFILDLYYKENLNPIYHQHLEDNPDDSACEKEKNCSHLPIINISTDGEEIPASLKKKDEYLTAELDVYDGGNNVSILGKNGTTHKINIRARGRSSLGFDKKSYTIKFIDDNEEKLTKSFLGMPEDNSWVLYGPYIDRSLIRNYMWYNIGQEIMTYAPKTRFVELYIDEEYKGLYVAVEKASQSEISRIKISGINKKSTATSYILQLDDEKQDELELESKSKYKANTLLITYPKEEELTEEIKEYIKEDFASFEEILYSKNFEKYSKYLDVYNFADYFIINEFTQNYDAGNLSTYIYKDVAGKYKMYIWDFNSANNNYEQDFLKKQTFYLNKTMWFEVLLESPEFVEIVIKRYKDLRKTYLSEEYIFNYIDETVEYLGASIERNYEVWDEMLKGPTKYMPTATSPKSHKEAIEQLKDAIHQRGEWLDENIEILRENIKE